ncbi:MAG: InlB B-repeat-containing protein, partial [Oscillospiraceae bacterium]|nr:InlB B-repeat-containing protein [Oscillospiraceae bacterium]
SVDESGDIEVDAYEAGSVTVNAPEKTGYTFSHWVRGTAANGVWVSSDASYKFDLVSPTYLTAIYVEENAKIVEFFNGNGELLAQETVNAEGKVALPKDPSMVGFKFLGWITGKTGDAATPFVNINITNSLRVIADYEVESTTYTVGDESGLKYDAEVTKTADSEDTVWKRNGEPVGYGKTYTYNVWSDTPTPITSEAFTGEKTPLVYLDRTVKAVGIENACMIEFDGAGKEIVEVGILFSSSGTPEVGSCMYKATSKTNGGDDGHGQLTAKPANNTQTVARGYIIYIDNGEYKTEYSDVLSLNN